MPVYLDHNASSPMRQPVIDAMTDVMQQAGNASSVHSFGRRHRQLVEDARAAVAELVGVKADRVVFTSGGTEANNLALKASGRQSVFVSAVEHDSILLADETAIRLPVDSDGVIDLSEMKIRLQQSVRLRSAIAVGAPGGQARARRRGVAQID